MLRGALRRAKWLAFSTLERLNRAASKVGQAPFFDTARFPWVADVERAFPDIRAELLEVQRTRAIPAFQEVSLEQAALTEGEDWKTWFLYAYGVRVDDNCTPCPRTDAALRRIPGMTTAMFSILAPGKHIPAHRGPYNGVLRYHLGVDIPTDAMACGIRVDDQTRQWANGASLVFDDTYEHEAWNDADVQRVVLFVDVKRPLRFPMNHVNDAVVALIRRTPYVSDGLERLREFHTR